MKILLIKGSPNRHGSSNTLANRFSEGATANGHTIVSFDAAHANIHPCFGCIHCGYDGPCIQHDDIDPLKALLLSSDMMVLVTPLYYFGVSSQLKMVIDRFCAFNGAIQRKHMKSALIASAWNADAHTFDALTLYYQTLVDYLNLDDQGMILAKGCGTVEMTQHSSYMDQAYRLGQTISMINK